MRLSDLKRQEMESQLRDIAGLIGPVCPDNVGFALLFFEHGEGGWASYISNSQREDMIKALRECADRLEGKTISDGQHRGRGRAG